ncbi:hypothetical protein SAMN05216490_0147 [Mucilaginibacter mallensis]|uniref:Uncharacterized protein n=2 Tax=Mucilaginibacter mallensis TaxID=652787 RepID=A0A1H1MRD8_MUCMA|nr:hypothetical protein SAMN05216490_0147 [Mucilaginibacter mallensis]
MFKIPEKYLAIYIRITVKTMCVIGLLICLFTNSVFSKSLFHLKEKRILKTLSSFLKVAKSGIGNDSTSSIKAFADKFISQLDFRKDLVETDTSLEQYYIFTIGSGRDAPRCTLDFFKDNSNHYSVYYNILELDLFEYDRSYLDSNYKNTILKSLGERIGLECDSSEVWELGGKGYITNNLYNNYQLAYQSEKYKELFFQTGYIPYSQSIIYDRFIGLPKYNTIYIQLSKDFRFLGKSITPGNGVSFEYNFFRLIMPSIDSLLLSSDSIYYKTTETKLKLIDSLLTAKKKELNLSTYKIDLYKDYKPTPNLFNVVFSVGLMNNTSNSKDTIKNKLINLVSGSPLANLLSFILNGFDKISPDQKEQTFDTQVGNFNIHTYFSQDFLPYCETTVSMLACPAP